MFRSAAHLLRPRSIAIVGASEAGGGGWAKAIHDNLQHTGTTASVYLINPKRTELWGRPVYASFAELPEPPDLALTIIPASAIPAALADGVAHGLKCALIYAAQFGEGGDPEGEARAASIRRLSRERGLRVCGPNCMGALSVREGLLLYPAARVRALQPGSVGVVFQSGGTFQFWLQQASIRGLGFSYAISSGNEIDLDLADYIDFMIDDDATRLIACMVEGIRRPDAFMAVAEKALRARKPILVVKLGRTEGVRAAAASHTGALAGNDEVFDAVCRAYGIVRCHSLDDLMETSLAFSQGRLPHGHRVAMVGYSGGAKGLFLDYASEEGVELARFAPTTIDALGGYMDPGLPAENPLDIGAQAGMQADKFAAVCKLVAADPNVDMVAVHGQLPVSAEDQMDATPFLQLGGATQKPIVAMGRISQNVGPQGRQVQAETGIPFLQGLPETIRALRGLSRYAEAVERGIARPPAPSSSGAPLDDVALAALLADSGVTPPRGGFAAAAADAADLAAEIGFPVALKVVSASAVHKTEVGGVALGLTSAADVIAAADAMARRLSAHNPRSRIDGFLVQEMVEGLETIVGVREDPLYGPFLVVGLGGIFVEVLKDVAIRLLPVDAAAAAEMIRSLRAAPLFKAFRGGRPPDVAGLADAIAGLSRVFMEHRGWLSDLEINPLIVLGEGDGVRAVDIRAIRQPPAGGDNARR